MSKSASGHPQQLTLDSLRHVLFSCWKAIHDGHASETRFELAYANTAFERFVGAEHDGDALAGRELSDLLERSGQVGLSLADAVRGAASTGEQRRHIHRCSESGDLYDICAYSDQPGYLAALMYHGGADQSPIADEQAAVEIRLRRQSTEQQILLDNIHTQVWYLTDPATYGAVNQSHAEFCGVPANRLAFSSIHDTFSPQVAQTRVRSNAEVFNLGRPAYAEQWVINAAGEERLLHIHKVPKLTASGDVELVVCSAEDITERWQAAEALRRSEERFKLAAASISDVIYEWRAEDDSILWFGDIDELLGYEPGEFPRTLDAWWDRVHPNDVHKLRTSARDGIAKRQRWAADCRVFRLDGEMLYVYYTGTGVYDHEGRAITVIGAVADITERRRYQTQLSELSYRDQLTGLGNRARLEDEMRRLEVEPQYPVSVISTDLNGLKLVNDTMGHSAGDSLLQVTAGLLSRAVRQGDVVARAGGDEFVILLPATAAVDAELVASRILKDVAAHNGSGEAVPVSLSLGVATANSPADSLAETLRLSDTLMYRDKLLRKASSRSQVMQTLVRALAERDYGTQGHVERLEQRSRQVGERLGLPANQLADLALLAQVHDLGKVGIPDRILHKAGPLDEVEWQVMRQHPEIGFRIASSSPDLADIADLILKHHERWDGTGYPRGLRGNEIPLACRVVAVVDAFDAMINDRHYRRAMPADEAVAELERCTGTQFDPSVVPVFLDVLRAEGVIT